MENSLLQARRRSRRAQRRALCVMIPLFLLILACITSISWLTLRAVKESFVLHLESALTTQAQQRVATLNAWRAEMQDQGKRIADADVIRLFASEVHNLGDADVESLLQLTDPPAIPETSPVPQHLHPLAPRVPLLHSLLMDLLKRSQFHSARLLNSHLRCFLASETTPQPLLPEEQEYARKALERAVPQFTPVRVAKGKSTGTLFLPLIAPDYLQHELGTAPLGLLCLDYEVTAPLRQDAADGERQGRLLQHGATGLEELLPADQGGLRPLPAWETDATDALPLAARTLPDGTEVFSLAVPITGLPWLVEQERPLSPANTEYRAMRWRVLLYALGALLLTISLLGMVWWRLLGKGERAVAEELGRLYRMVNRQKQLLDGINNALTDGVMLQHQDGLIQYVNPACAVMLGRNASEIQGKSIEDILGIAVAEQFKKHTDSVLRYRSPTLFTTELDLGDGKHAYQIACSPYRETNGEITGVVSLFHSYKEILQEQRNTRTLLVQLTETLASEGQQLSPAIRRHSIRIARLVSMLARALGCDTAHEQCLFAAASLSCLGLSRPLPQRGGSLTLQERSPLEAHIQQLCDTLGHIDFGLPVLPILCQIYERLDGSGCPLGLQGSEIPLDARILAVADSFLSMTQRCSTMDGIDDALATLAQAPSRYDPCIVTALYELLNSPDGQHFLQELLHDGNRA